MTSLARRCFTAVVVSSFLATQVWGYPPPGGRGGGARRGGGGPSPGAGPRPASGPGAGQRATPPGGNAARPQPNPAATRTAAPKTSQNLQSFLNGTTPPLAEARTDAASQAQQRLAAFSPDSQPFTAEWYLDHPNAWKATHPHADAWAVATAASLGRWLTFPVVASGTNSTTTGTAATESTTASSTPEATTSSAQTGQSEVSGNADDWLPLGVFTLASAAESQPTRMVQLAVNREGILRGSHLDVISDDVQPVQGSVDKKTMRAAWTVGAKGKVVFQTDLSTLNADSLTVTARYPSGQSGKWELIPERKPTKE